MEQASKSKVDRPEFESKWTTRRQKAQHTYRDKLMSSFAKCFETNLESVKNSQDCTTEIKSLINDLDHLRLDQ
jgi:hypothetical protein